jgi:hypothetical protein
MTMRQPPDCLLIIAVAEDERPEIGYSGTGAGPRARIPILTEAAAGAGVGQRHASTHNVGSAGAPHGQPPGESSQRPSISLKGMHRALTHLTRTKR